MTDSNYQNFFRDEALNNILSSIALEEVALGNLINSESEKIQYVIGSLGTSPTELASIEEVLKINDSVRATLEASTRTQIILKEKMDAALRAGSTIRPECCLELIKVREVDYLKLTPEQKLSNSILWVIYPNNFF